ncbi:S41 family peptidase [Lentzea sp. NPDC051838]|uniref:S41 family peptidase n=1 Tax=Lentzea sp. NPDC051838 TaxID=3154849 RepID=UPI003419A77D
MIKHALLAALLLITTAGEPVSATRAYLDTALNLLQQYSVESPKADWPKLRAQAHAEAADAERPSDTYPVINETIEALGNPHTVLLASPEGGAPDPFGMVPDGRMIGSTAYLKLPAISVDLGQEYVDAGLRLMRDLIAARPGSWVVDLRGNTGGDMRPMLTVVAPLLGEGRKGMFVGPDGSTADWGVVNGHLYAGGEMAFPQVEVPPAVTGPVAVLVDAMTSSSGEAVLLSFTGQAGTRSFGAPTGGFATVNASFTLPDGARLAVTTAYMADRTGRTYGNTPIAPQTPVGDGDALAAAIEWLAQRP